MKSPWCTRRCSYIGQKSRPDFEAVKHLDAKFRHETGDLHLVVFDSNQTRPTGWTGTFTETNRLVLLRLAQLPTVHEEGLHLGGHEGKQLRRMPRMKADSSKFALRSIHSLIDPLIDARRRCSTQITRYRLAMQSSYQYSLQSTIRPLYDACWVEAASGWELAFSGSSCSEKGRSEGVALLVAVLRSHFFSGSDRSIRQFVHGIRVDSTANENLVVTPKVLNHTSR
jgi:hypothetical protein